MLQDLSWHSPPHRPCYLACELLFCCVCRPISWQALLLYKLVHYLTCSEDLNLGPSSCTANVLPTEPSPQTERGGKKSPAYFTCMCVEVKGQLLKSVFSFHHTGPGNGTQVAWHMSNASHLPHLRTVLSELANTFPLHWGLLPPATQMAFLRFKSVTVSSPNFGLLSIKVSPIPRQPAS